jgi:hypothetical protein
MLTRSTRMQLPELTSFEHHVGFLRIHRPSRRGNKCLNHECGRLGRDQTFLNFGALRVPPTKEYPPGSATNMPVGKGSPG